MRKISSLLAIWAVMIMAMPTFANTRLQDDLITIGKPGSTANKRIKLGSQEIRSNTATSKLEYTHDGVTYKPIGSGSGSGGSSGGINLVANDSFEDPITTGWSNTGGTLTQESYDEGTESDAKFARFVATAAGQYFETPLITVPTNFSGGCQADFKKISVSGNDLFKLEILDSSSNVLAAGNIKQSSWVKFPTIGTPCPTPGSQFRLRVTSLAAGTIDADYGYLGSNQNLVNIAQAKLLGTVTISGCAGSFVNSSTTLSNPTAQTGCIYTTTGQAVADTSFGLTQLPSIKFNRIEAGEIRVEYEGGLRNQTTAKTAYFQFSDGTNNARELSTTLWSVSAGTGYAFVPSISQSISYSTAQNNVSIVLRSKTDSGGITEVTGSTANPGVIKVWYFPKESDVAVNTDQASWFIDANIGGSNATISSLTSTYTEVTSSGLDLVINSSKGSASAQIPCSGTNPSTGLTCSAGNESIGISFIPPSAGVYEVCADFTPNLDSVTTGNNATRAVFQLIETPNNAQTILQEGGERKDPYVYKQNLGTGGVSVSTPMKLCGTFSFSDTSRKTIRLMYESSALNPNIVIYADRGATEGQRDLKFTVRPFLSSYNRPILTGDQVKTRGAINPEIFSAAYGGASLNSVCPTSSSCTLYNKIGTGISSVNQATAGAFTLGFDKTFSVVNCTATTIGASTVAPPVNSGTTPPMSCSNCNSMIFVTGNPASTYVSTYGTINCIAIP